MGTPVTARTDRAEPPRASPSILVIIRPVIDRKSTRLNSSHLVISYAVFCLKKKKNKKIHIHNDMRKFKSTPTASYYTDKLSTLTHAQYIRLSSLPYECMHPSYLYEINTCGC